MREKKILTALMSLCLLAGCASSSEAASAEPTVSASSGTVDAIVAPVSDKGAVSAAYTEEASAAVTAVEGSVSGSDQLFLYAGMSLPDTVFQDYDGNSVKLSDYEGKNVVIEIIANWCEYCQKMNRENLTDEVQNHADIQFIQMFYNGTAEEIDAFYKATDAEKQDSVIILPESEEVQDFAVSTGLNQFPTFLFYDQTGKLSWVETGVVTEERLTAIIPYAFGSETRIYDELKENENPFDYYRTESDVRNDLTDEAVSQIDAMDSTGNYARLLYQLLSRDVKVDTDAVDSQGNTIPYSDTEGKIILYQILSADSATDQTAQIQAVNQMAEEKDFLLITIVAEGDTEAKQWLSTLSVQPEGYIYYQADETYPSNLFFAQLIVPSEIFVNGTTGRSMGIAFAKDTDSLNQAYELYCGSSPVYAQVKSTAKTVEP